VLHNKTHKELYPEQYAHPLCGKWVAIQGTYDKDEDGEVTGLVVRVVSSRFGQLAILHGSERLAYSVRKCRVIG